MNPCTVVRRSNNPADIERAGTRELHGCVTLWRFAGAAHPVADQGAGLTFGIISDCAVDRGDVYRVGNAAMLTRIYPALNLYLPAPGLVPASVAKPSVEGLTPGNENLGFVVAALVIGL
jgi:hypothetical protein